MLVKCSPSAFLVLAGITSVDTVDFSKLTTEQVYSALETKIRMVQRMARNRVVISAVKAQNGEKLKPATIKTRNTHWKKSSRKDPFMHELQISSAGQFLQRKVNQTEEFTTAYVTDCQGAYVAAYSAIRDYGQARHESWKACWNEGIGSIYVSKPQRNRKSGNQSLQIAAPVKDRGVTIGVLVIDVGLGRIKDTA